MTQSKNPAFQQSLRDYRAELVAIDHAAISRLTPPLGAGRMGSILEGSPMAGRPLLFTACLLAMNVLNYQFWDVDQTGAMTRYQHNGLVGALAMQAGFLGCWASYVPDRHAGDDVKAIQCAVDGIRSELDMRDLQGLFGAIPSPASRLEVLDEVLDASMLMAASQVLVSRMQRDSALGWQDAQMLAHLFPKGYGDPYLKKAQLTLMFLAAEWQASGPDGHQSIALDVTAAADYQLPKVLRALGVLRYSESAATPVDSGLLIEQDSMLERAIRAATLMACAELAVRFDCDIASVDNWLWMQRNVARDAKFHLTFTTSY